MNISDIKDMESFQEYCAQFGSCRKCQIDKLYICHYYTSWNDRLAKILIYNRKKKLEKLLS